MVVYLFSSKAITTRIVMPVRLRNRKTCKSNPPQTSFTNTSRYQLINYLERERERELPLTKSFGVARVEFWRIEVNCDWRIDEGVRMRRKAEANAMESPHRPQPPRKNCYCRGFREGLRFTYRRILLISRFDFVFPYFYTCKWVTLPKIYLQVSAVNKKRKRQNQQPFDNRVII